MIEIIRDGFDVLLVGCDLGGDDPGSFAVDPRRARRALSGLARTHGGGRALRHLAADELSVWNAARLTDEEIVEEILSAILHGRLRLLAVPAVDGISAAPSPAILRKEGKAPSPPKAAQSADEGLAGSDAAPEKPLERTYRLAFRDEDDQPVKSLEVKLTIPGKGTKKVKIKSHGKGEELRGYEVVTSESGPASCKAIEGKPFATSESLRPSGEGWKQRIEAAIKTAMKSSVAKLGGSLALLGMKELGLEPKTKGSGIAEFALEAVEGTDVTTALVGCKEWQLAPLTGAPKTTKANAKRAATNALDDKLKFKSKKQFGKDFKLKKGFDFTIYPFLLRRKDTKAERVLVFLGLGLGLSSIPINTGLPEWRLPEWEPGCGNGKKKAELDLSLGLDMFLDFVDYKDLEWRDFESKRPLFFADFMAAPGRMVKVSTPRIGIGWGCCMFDFGGLEIEKWTDTLLGAGQARLLLALSPFASPEFDVMIQGMDLGGETSMGCYGGAWLCFDLPSGALETNLDVLNKSLAVMFPEPHLLKEDDEDEDEDGEKKPAPKLLVGSLPDADVGATYYERLPAGGGESPYEVKATGLPPGLRLEEEDQRWSVRGTPTEGGDFSVELTIVDHARTAGDPVRLTLRVKRA